MTIILFTILLGLAGEMINTAIESVTDLVTTEWHMEAKIAKDVSAGMMLLIAFGAICVALFLVHIYFHNCRYHYMAFLLGSLLLSWIIASLLYVPFIRLLYRWRFQRLKQKSTRRI